MGFLTINGVPIRVVEGGELIPQEIGASARSFGGTYLRDRRAIKRRWNFTTPLMPQDEAKALIGLILGQGHFWKFDPASGDDPIEAGTDTLTASSGGLVTNSRTGTFLVRNTAEDGKNVANVYSAPATTALVAQRSGALSISLASDNELPANQRIGDNTGATPFSSVGGATLTDETTNVLMGTNALKIATSGVSQGARAASIAALPTEVWTGSVYLLGDSGSESVTLQVLDNNSGITPKTVTLSATEWRRVWVTHTVVAGATSVFMQVASNSGTPTFYADNWQMEESAVPTTWYDGTRASDDELEFDGSWLQTADAFTFAGWSNGKPDDAGINHIFNISDGTTDNRFFLRWLSNEVLNVGYTLSGVAASDSDVTAQTYGEWTHVAMVYEQKTGMLKGYRNGVEVVFESGVTLDLADLDTIHVGKSPTGGTLNGELDDVFLAPYAMTTAQLLSIYNSGTAVAADSPNLICSGDFTCDEQVICKGSVKRAAYQPAMNAGSWANNQHQITFVLEEV